VIGTPTYMAPEQMQTARSTDPRSDIWSMGVVMYQMLAGRPPFEAENYAQLVLMVASSPPAPLTVPLPGGLQSIVFRCLEKDPRNRFQNVGELARMLAPYASDPMSAQQSAERASRILSGGATRNSQASFGGLSQQNAGVGMQMTPPALTPKSWGNNGPSSVGGAAGQLSGTKVVRGGRGLVIGTVAGLCVAAGIGGFAISHAMKSDSTTASDTSQHVTAPEGTPAAAPTPAPAPAENPNIPTAPPPIPEPPKADTAKVEPAKTDTAKTDTAKTDTAKTDTAKTDTAKTDTAKTDAAKTDTAKTTKTTKTDVAKTTTAKTDSAKTTTAKSDRAKTDSAKTTKTSTTKTTTTKTPPKGDDLFNDRH